MVAPVVISQRTASISERLKASSNKNYRLRGRNFKSFAATGIAAGEHVIDANHIVARFLKPGALLFIHPPRRRRFLRSPQPAHIVLGALAAKWTGERRALGFLFLVEEIAFPHAFILP